MKKCVFYLITCFTRLCAFTAFFEKPKSYFKKNAEKKIPREKKKGEKKKRERNIDGFCQKKGKFFFVVFLLGFFYKNGVTNKKKDPNEIINLLFQSTLESFTPLHLYHLYHKYHKYHLYKEFEFIRLYVFIYLISTISFSHNCVSLVQADQKEIVQYKIKLLTRRSNLIEPKKNKKKTGFSYSLLGSIVFYGNLKILFLTILKLFNI